MELCEADIRCLDAHAHFGNFVFDRLSCHTHWVSPAKRSVRPESCFCLIMAPSCIGTVRIRAAATQHPPICKRKPYSLIDLLIGGVFRQDDELRKLNRAALVLHKREYLNFGASQWASIPCGERNFF
jgi:hypothetical protein